MKKTYISPDIEVVELACGGNLMQIIQASENADPSQEVDAPRLNDDELFQLFLIK